MNVNSFTNGKHIRAAIIRADGTVETFGRGRQCPGKTPVQDGDTIVACGMSVYPYAAQAAKLVNNEFEKVKFVMYDGGQISKILADW